MKHEPGVFDSVDEEAEALADAEAIADADAGRMISHEAVKKWLQSWGTGNKLPAPQVGN